MTKIIGITGLAGSGKDTLADELEAHFTEGGYSVLRTSFAEPIRNIAKAIGLDPFDRDKKEVEVTLRFSHIELDLIEHITAALGDFVGEDDLCDLYAGFVTVLRSRGYIVTDRQDKLTISPRRFCQLLGTEGGRSVRSSFWVDVLRARIAKLGTTVPGPVARKYGPYADVALVPDVRFANEFDVCDTVIGIDRPGVTAVEPHASEAEIPTLVESAHTKYHNEGTLEDLGRYAAGVADAIREGSL